MELSARILEYIRSHKGKCEVYAAPFAVYLDDTTGTYVEPDISVICDPDKLDDQDAMVHQTGLLRLFLLSSKRNGLLIRSFLNTEQQV